MRVPAALSAVVLLFCSAGVLCGESISVGEYVRRLEGISDALAAGDLPEVRRGARALLDGRIAYGGGVVYPDRTILTPLSNVGDIDEAGKWTGRLKTLIESLGGAAGALGDETGPQTDAGLIERLRREEEVADPGKGGETGGFIVGKPRYPNWLLRFFAKVGKKLVSAWGHIKGALWKIVEFLVRLLFPGGAGGPGLSVTRLMIITLIVVLLIVMAVVVVYILRRGGAVPIEPVSSAGRSAVSDRDAEPLSRTANEWERYARELAGGGRYREAVRAWYHAVLVTLYRAGLLHYRKGRTNWEYAYSLSPDLRWRPDFMALTRSFEREWYGRFSSTGERAESYALEAGRLLGKVGDAGGGR